MKLASDLELALLGLAVKWSSGRQLAQAYELRQRRPISYGSLYTTLRRMVEAGWLRQREDEDADGRLRWYVVTGEGRRAEDNTIRYRTEQLRAAGHLKETRS